MLQQLTQFYPGIEPILEDGSLDLLSRQKALLLACSNGLKETDDGLQQEPALTLTLSFFKSFPF